MAVVPALLVLFVVAVSGQIQVTPREAVRKVGEEVDVLCRVSYPITLCRVEVGGDSYVLTPKNTGSSGEPVYYGKGLESGECGAHITNIKEQWNGNVVCSVTPQTGSKEIKDAMKLTVASAPGPPHLDTPQQTELKEGENFKAKCTVPAGRPAATISWYLGDEEILNGLEPPVITNSTNAGLETITQVLNRILTADDDKKSLICRANHAALSRPLEARRQLDVQYPPRLIAGSLEDQITIFGLKLQEDGHLNVTVRSNPEPSVEWKVSDVTLNPAGHNKHHNENSEWTALHPLRLPQDVYGSGYFNITLVLSPVTKEDVDRNYFLTLNNNHGEKRLVVKVSTLDEPAGVELDAGAIVGIVVGVLLLLLAVFLVVFAKATDRWCFAGSPPLDGDSEAPLPPHDDVNGAVNPSHDHEYIGNGSRGRDHTKSSGESDTESAVGGRPSRLAGLGARMRSVLPRGKDKVQATEPQADKPLAEEKKGVVYAELALGEQTSDKPQPPSTEYAEIVYTEPPKETKE